MGKKYFPILRKLRERQIVLHRAGYSKKLRYADIFYKHSVVGGKQFLPVAHIYIRKIRAVYDTGHGVLVDSFSDTYQIVVEKVEREDGYVL